MTLRNMMIILLMVMGPVSLTKTLCETPWVLVSTPELPRPPRGIRAFNRANGRGPWAVDRAPWAAGHAPWAADLALEAEAHGPAALLIAAAALGQGEQRPAAEVQRLAMQLRDDVNAPPSAEDLREQWNVV